MKIAPLPPDESERLATLYALKVLDTPSEAVAADSPPIVTV